MPLVVVRHPVFAASLLVSTSFWIFNCPDPTGPDTLPVPTSIVFNPASIVAGSSAIATVGLSGPAPSGGVRLTVRIVPSQYVTYPPTVDVPPGSRSVEFSLTTRAEAPEEQIEIVVAANGVELTARTILVSAPKPEVPLTLYGIAIDHDDVPCGAEVHGTLALNRPVAQNDPRTVVVDVDVDRASTTPTFVVLSGGTVSQRFRVLAPGGLTRDETGDVVATLGREAEALARISTRIRVYGCVESDSITPDSGRQGEAVDVTVQGSNFRGPVTVISDGIQVSNARFVDSTRVTARLTIPEDAATGPRRVYVRTPTGTAWEYFTVLTGVSAVPALTSISPASGNVGFNVPVTITGTSFTGGASVAISGGDVTISGVTVVNSTTITATFQIGQFAAGGARNVTVTTADGTSNAVTFTIIP